MTNDTFHFKVTTTTNTLWVIRQPGLLDSESRDLALLILSPILSCVVAVFGLTANTINIAVFIKQGFKENITVSFAVLAVFDSASLLAILWIAISSNPLVRDHPDLPFRSMELINMTGSMPRSYMSRMSSLVTLYISVERCVCVIKPLGVKKLFNRRRFLVSITLIAFICILLLGPVYFGSKLVWKMNPFTNKTVLGVLLLAERRWLSAIPSSIDTVLATTCFVAIVVCAVILIRTLKQRKRWIDKDPGTNKSNALSPKDRKAAFTVTLVAVVFIVCSFPTTVCRFTMMAVGEFNRGGRYVNIYLVTWSLAFLMDAISASCNIFVYAFTSVRYRKALQSLFKCYVGQTKN